MTRRAQHAVVGKNFELQAHNHEVTLYPNPPLSGEDQLLIALGDFDPDDLEHLLGVSEGSWVVRCHTCAERWSPEVGQGGDPKGLWWLCPNLCNLSERTANRLLREMREGRREPDAELAERCLAHLRRLIIPKRAETFENLDRDPEDYVIRRIKRSHDWRHRDSEWSDELDAAYDEFD